MGDRERRRECGEVRVVSRCARYKRQGGKRGMEGERTWKVRDGNGGKDNEMCVCACVCVRACVHVCASAHASALQPVFFLARGDRWQGAARATS